MLLYFGLDFAILERIERVLSWRPLVRALVVRDNSAEQDLNRVKLLTARRSGFTLIDVLVSMAVVGVLIAIMLPSLASVRETAHQVVCRSNVRQIGFGIELYAESNKSYLPRTQTNVDPLADFSYDTITLRFVLDAQTPVPISGWDGLGLLFSENYLPAPKIFYCPSHKGDHPYREYEDMWRQESGEIVGNFQFRGAGPTGTYLPGGQERMSTRMDLIRPRSALVADGMRSQSDFNHLIGANVLRSDLSVFWFGDADRSVVDSLPKDGEPPTAIGLQNAWHELDFRFR